MKEEAFHEDEAPSGENDLTEMDKLQKQLDQYKGLAEQLQKQAEENHQQLLRAHADLENVRRRARKEKEDALKFAVVPLLESLLPVLDNFERALEAADQNNDFRGLQEGVEMVYRQFLNVLSQAGLTMIEAEGKPFDPHQHNAVMQVESDQHEPGIVVEELQTGYRYQDRVIRPSMVKVSS
ncbi:nucleotide exchange factor GrpE [Paenactinomyces guangxiensis]|uniref:Protein GrpE n=2 Tax=Paenactinomyces guangxiensis TaxID=1490290 RepID=A0A7W2A7G8_9BACL|nr:nucleotide exchange factor GrpE [Paenactinomyces guangxiensis]MBH8590023.1 nucleotide exchange factor GrpE [Paenactinomyces guangxiensis]